ncbi:uncharacterized protein LOC126376311 [Pectinophora gossypiella]|nr:uncharacterized protein LOC126376311 [Pectinophora gossypiella]
MAYTLDVELFIGEVKKYPVIWDLNSENHRYKNRKQAAWEEIAKVLIEDFNDMTEEEKIDVYKKLNSKWRNIRDSFVRNAKRKDGKKGGYMYAKHLTFLNNTYKQNSDEEWSDEETRKKANLTKTEVDSWSIEEDNSLESVKRKIDKQDTIEYVDTPVLPDATCSYPIEDEDRSFFDSLLPAVRKFDLDQKLEFRSEVLCLIKTIRNSDKRLRLDASTGEFRL